MGRVWSKLFFCFHFFYFVFLCFWPLQVIVMRKGLLCEPVGFSIDHTPGASQPGPTSTQIEMGGNVNIWRRKKHSKWKYLPNISHTSRRQGLTARTNLHPDWDGWQCKHEEKILKVKICQCPSPSSEKTPPKLRLAWALRWACMLIRKIWKKLEELRKNTLPHTK